MTPFLTILITFTLLAIASKQVGRLFSAIGLPYITGYLLIGMLGGPFILELLPKGTADELRFIDEISLGIIAFVAGSELYLQEIRPRLKSIGTILGSVILISLPLSGLALFFLTEFIPFTQGMTTTERLAVAILGTTILLALSPPSTIAVIKEVRAKGNFTNTLLGVTVTMDVLIVILFAIAVAFTSALLTQVGLSLSFLAILLIDLGAAVVGGYIVGRLLQAVLAMQWPKLLKIGLIVLLGYAVFWGSHAIVELTHNWFIEIHIEPLLVAMIAGFYITNYTNHRKLFEDLLHDIGPIVYVAFFTLTGVGIKLDILSQTWPIAVVLFLVRFSGINLGGFIGSRLAGESPKFTRFMGLGLITQAGIALGLSREVAIEFPALGDAFSTMVISVVVLNEVFGPMFLKEALKRVGETAEERESNLDETREVIIAGIEAQSIELARQLQKVGWQATLIDTDESHVAHVEDTAVAVHHLPQLTEENLRTLISPQVDALVAMLPNDEDNLLLCNVASRRNVSRLVARPTALSSIEDFTSLGALVVDPTSAMVNLLEQTVRAPHTAAVLLHQDPSREMVQITISNPDVDGALVRDLRLPTDVLFMDVSRDGNVILPNGYTRLHLRDEVTLVGRQESLDEVMLKLGF